LPLSRTVFEIFDFKNAVTLKTGLGVCQCHWKCYHYIQRIRLPIGSISCRFWNIQCRKISWPWNPGQRSLKVIRTDTDRSATRRHLWLPINVT